MTDRLFAWRAVLNLFAAAAVAVVGLRMFPLPLDNLFLGLVAAQRPALFHSIVYGYATVWFTTPLILLSVATSLLLVIRLQRDRPLAFAPLPAYPPPASRKSPFLVIGERHEALEPVRAPEPTWLTIPQRGLYTGIAIFGAVGTGKTSGCMYPFAEQLLTWGARDPDRRMSGLVLEVKGDFCHRIQRLLADAGRGDDYIEIGLRSPYCYNPLHNDLEPYALAYSIATLLNNLYGKGKEPFWQQAYTDLVKFIILLRKVVDGYTTLQEVYRYAINESLIAADLKRAKERMTRPTDLVVVSEGDFAAFGEGSAWPHWFAYGDKLYAHAHCVELQQFLTDCGVAFRVESRAADGTWEDRAHQLEAVDRWYHDNWHKLEPRLRSSIVEGIAVFLSLFDDNPEVFRTFCPPREAYVPGAAGAGARASRRPLPPLTDLLESGRVLALNFPVSMNPSLAKALGVMLKMDFQRAVLSRIPKMAEAPEKVWRDILFICDEYHHFATTGESDPTGDERTFALSRQARLIPIVATQSISSLRSALPGDEAWRTLLQCFRTKIFLAVTDELTARTAAELCGRTEQWKASYSLTEAAPKATVSWLTGRTAAHESTITAAKQYHPRIDLTFQPRVFTELRNAQAVALAYDGIDPQPPTYLYLKPHYLDVQTSYFDHVDAGRL